MSHTLTKYQKTIKLQKKLASKVISKNEFRAKFQKICGVDVSYKNDTAFCSAVIYDIKQKKIIETANSKIKSKIPYIPGLFMLKESKPIITVLKKLKQNFDLLLVDGNGQLHPRFCGLACYIGLKCNIPTIGVAKKLLCGKIQDDSKVLYGGKIMGNLIKKNKKIIYVSVGNKISLKTATRLVNEMIMDDYWYPEPLRIADFNSKQLSRS
jgi:deoxyribonuclease V